MTDRFRSFGGLLDAVADRSFDRPPALVCNAHVTGLGVARALAAHGVPVVAMDRTGEGVAPGSSAVDLAGRVTYPLDDPAGFREDVERLAAATDHDPVAFGCMDEWVHALVRTRPEGVVLPFAADAVDAVLDKESLYALGRSLDVPVPETYRLAGPGRGGDEAAGGGTAADGGNVAGGDGESTGTGANDNPGGGGESPGDGGDGGGAGPGADGTVAGDPLPLVSPAEAADALGFPLVVKPALKREFEEAVGTNVIEVPDREAFDDVVERARTAGVRVMAQEKVPVATGEDCSLASYVPPEGDPLWVVGNAAVRYPRGYGTSCVVDLVDRPGVARRALSVLEASGYHGISESEFVYDDDRGTFVLLDVNTRPWKWISMPVAAGANLPMAAYASVTDATYQPDDPSPTEAGGPSPTRWVYLRDYLALLGEDPGFTDVLTDGQWRALLSGSFEAGEDLTTGVYRPSDPAPALDLLRTEFSAREYYCAC